MSPQKGNIRLLEIGHFPQIDQIESSQGPCDDKKVYLETNML